MRRLAALIGMAAMLAGSAAHAYPTDAGERTGIRRLDWQQKIDAGEVRGKKTPPGARWPSKDIVLRMTGKDARHFELDESTPRDPELQAGLEAILKKAGLRKYNIAILDITNPTQPRYAAINETLEQTPGSVAKVLVASALFRAIADRFPKIGDREKFLRTTQVDADRWLMPNHHQVPVKSGRRFVSRRIRVGDSFSLWEWLDHALSPSSNAAATMVWREAVLLRLLGKAYPPERRDKRPWSRWAVKDFTREVFRAVDAPLEDAGIDPHTFRLRLFFTGGASRYLHSRARRTTPLALVQWMLRVEQGRMVDAFSSLELKRLLYMTRKRIRYAFSRELHGSAVFFKSGSLYKCKPASRYRCGKYRGNLLNVLNSLVLIESPSASGRPVVYIVAVMSNQLKRNASGDHAKLGAMIHRMMTADRL